MMTIESDRHPLVSESENEKDISVFTEASHHFENVLFAESRDGALSQNIAAYLRDHHQLKCHPISVGTSEKNEKTVEVKEISVSTREMVCSGPLVGMFFIFVFLRFL